MIRLVCPTCAGRGRTVSDSPQWVGDIPKFIRVDHPCGDCQGHGYLLAPDEATLALDQAIIDHDNQYWGRGQ